MIPRTYREEEDDLLVSVGLLALALLGATVTALVWGAILLFN